MKGSFKVLAATFCLLAAGSSLNAQEDPVTGKIIEMGRNDNHSMDYLDILCNRFGGRLIGSDAYDNAAERVVNLVPEMFDKVTKLTSKKNEASAEAAE